jgi:hypothetical protein
VRKEISWIREVDIKLAELVGKHFIVYGCKDPDYTIRDQN